MARIISGKVSARPGDASTSTATTSSSSSSWMFLNSVTATNSSVLSSGSFASVASSYVAIQAVISGVKVATQSELGFRTSSDGTNYAATDGAYTFSNVFSRSIVDTRTILGSTSTNIILVACTAATAAAPLATSAGDAFNAVVTLHNLNATATAAFPTIAIDATWMATADVAGARVFGRRVAAISQGGIQLVNRGAGNFIDGRMDVFGLV